MAARFGEMLLGGRRQMGQSIQQVANIIKIRPQIIEYFESGDFDAMPPRGYAQGMIASYARYLGLNPRRVVDAYFDDLYEHERRSSRKGGRLEDAAGLVRSRPPSARGFEMPSITDETRSRFAQRPPQAGYVPESVSDHESIRIAGGRGPDSNQAVHRLRPRQGAGRFSEAGRRGPDSSGRGGRARDGRPSARIREEDRGRRSRSRGGSSAGIARDAARDRQRAYGSRSLSARRRSGSGGRAGGVAHGGALSDGRIVAGGIGLLLVLIVVAAALLLHGCVAPGGSGSPSSHGGPASSQTKPDASSETPASSEAASSPAATSPAEPEQPIVKITVADGKSAWVEVKVDDAPIEGSNVIGPYSKTYTVTKSIQITVDRPGDVKVTKNGVAAHWDSEMSGIARLTITAPVPSSAASSENPDANDGGAQAQQ